MELFAPPEETIVGVSAESRSGRRSCRDVLEACLGRIDAREAEVRAWVVIDLEGARRQADRIDADRRAGRTLGPIAGIPVGIKDIIDVLGLPTAFGVPEAPGRAADDDAPIVAELRRRGAVILGKTVSTPYAWVDTPPTRNPWNLDRTPGGSSSGSAAAVACGMCLGALGSQTGGSITRPASYCGVSGFKPTFGSRSLSGVLPLAPSLDHPGPIARTVGDLALLADVRPGGTATPPTIGRLRGFFEDHATPAMRSAMDRVLATLAEAGAIVVEVPLPDDFEDFAGHHYHLMAAEAAAFHRIDRGRHPERFPPRITRLIDDGLGLKAVDYLAARRHRDRLREELLDRLPGVDAFATPAAPAAAPGPETTGDPRFNSPWSLAGFPTVALPIALDPDGLPLGLQLVGRPGPGGEAGLFGVGIWCESAVRRAAGAPELPPPGWP
ncbi:amidase [Tautonia plasticadhaerens]|uniref:Glutamyl-tRNA(Gln) amidotransferase subunit A n=1 Tax=Tautonia plasticadhaerens TaxID=2527974 RepID=A0A518H366_9BACT|nr:amidase [Tautonia plasticadhaerens]QDV35282.1 Glutamyl-tRNA(Gln) amidotransferase subunit A [Tautonia plasticadhaerens]